MLGEFALDPSVAHVNHGSFGAVPRVVLEEQRRIRDRAEANPMRFFRVEAPALRVQARETAARFLGVAPEEMALVRNVTEASSTVLSALAGQGRLGPGDLVVLSTQSYGAVRLGVEHWCARTGASYQVVDLPVGEADVAQAYRHAVTTAVERGLRARLVVVDHIASPTGAVLPVAEVAAAARAVGALTYVDAAHVPGQLPADPAATGADFWSGTWHKWGFAARGTTGLWVAEPERDALVPLTTSWNHGLPFPQPFDMRGTDDYSAWMSLHRAVEFWSDAGGPEIAARSSDLLDKAAEVVRAVLPDVDVPLPAVPAPCLRLLPLPDGVATSLEAADEVYERLSAQGVEAQVVAHDGRGYLRLSATVYNELADYERLADALVTVLG